MGGDYGSVGWLCDSSGDGSAVIKQRKGEKGCEQAVFYKQACMNRAVRWTVEGNWVWPKNKTKLNDKNKIKDLNNI